MKKFSVPGHRVMPENSQLGLDLDNVYQLTLLNTSDFDVLAVDTEIGSIELVPNVPFVLNGHPEYPFKVSFKFQFPAEGEKNSVTATYIRSYGNMEK